MDRKKGLDFVRAVSAIGIIVFHFYCHSSSAHKLFYAHANGAWGGVLNYLFFCAVRIGHSAEVWSAEEAGFKKLLL